MGRQNGFDPDACMKHTLQADPTVAVYEVSLSSVNSLENLFTQFALERGAPTRMAVLQLSFTLRFLCSVLHYPQVQPRLAVKNISQN